MVIVVALPAPVTVIPVTGTVVGAGGTCGPRPRGPLWAAGQRRHYSADNRDKRKTRDQLACSRAGSENSMFHIQDLPP